ncbi:hypothetical protein GCM10023158_33700 [Gluconacetobacter tumulicola]
MRRFKKHQPCRPPLPHQQNGILPKAPSDHPSACQRQTHGEQRLSPLSQPPLTFPDFASRQTCGQCPHSPQVPAIRPAATTRIGGADEYHVTAPPPCGQRRIVPHRALSDPHRYPARTIQAPPICKRGRGIDRPQTGHDLSPASPKWSLRCTQADISRPKPNITVNMADPP